jgi:hypothetical protein
MAGINLLQDKLLFLFSNYICILNFINEKIIQVTITSAYIL